MATITSLVGTDAITTGDSMTKINTNFTNLNADKIETSVLDTDTALTANSDAKVATQKAVKAYVDAGGNVNASETTKGIVEEATDAEVTAGTATGGTGAKLFITPAKLATYLPTVISKGVINTSFETAARFTQQTDAGASITFDTTGAVLSTGATGGRACSVKMDVGSTANNVFTGSPVFSASVIVLSSPATGSSYFGMGAVTYLGTGHTYTTDHCGFKIIASGSVMSLYGTQGDGSTESATSALTTVVATDTIHLMLKINGTSSVDYYWRKNGGAWSSATNLTTNLANTASNIFQFSASNDSTANNNNYTLVSASYTV